MADQSVLTLEDVSKHYGDLKALNGISFSVETGNQVAIIGPSGAGKTTLLQIISGQEAPDSGRVQVAGHGIHELTDRTKRSRLIGMMSQQFDLIEELPVTLNVQAGNLGEWGLFRTLFRVLFPRSSNEVLQALDRVGLNGKRIQKTRTLSGGEQQRVALARLLVQRPEVILADEPVASVDPARARDVIEILQEVTTEDGFTLVCSLHDVELALEYFPRLIGLREGKIVFDRAPDELEARELEALYASEAQHYSPSTVPV